MNGDIKRYIYIIAGIVVMFFAVSVFLHILPWLLLAGVIGYVITKVVGFIKAKTEEKHSNKFDNGKDDAYNYNVQSDDYTNGEVIDVDYEDVDDKKD